MTERRRDRTRMDDKEREFCEMDDSRYSLAVHSSCSYLFSLHIYRDLHDYLFLQGRKAGFQDSKSEFLLRPRTGHEFVSLEPKVTDIAIDDGMPV